MADVCTTMPSDGESPAQCREARRCSIDPSRSRASAAAGESSSRGEKRFPSPEPDPSIGEKRIRTKEPGLPSFSAEEAPPSPFGCVSLCGLSREMEDAVSVRPGFCRRAGGEPLDFFGVFDGHGGAHVSTLCRERMHELVAEEMGRVGPAEGEWKEAVAKAFARMDEVALESCACGRVGPGPGPCPCDRSGFESDIVGSTAVIAIVGRDRVLVANCGDSRAVLSRAGRALPLSVDHKPDRPDELARIEAAGGRVIYLNGARVHGILAMSRAVGDKYLKPVVISDPEIVVMERRMEDECLIIASDGLWDVLSNELACDVARRCLQEGAPLRYATGAMSGGGSGGEGERQASDTRCSMAAALLARLALGRKSGDNISVIVIDLKSGSGHQLSR